MKFTIFTILFGGEILNLIKLVFPLGSLQNPAFPSGGLPIPPDPVSASVGVTEVSNVLFPLTGNVNALTVKLNIFAQFVSANPAMLSAGVLNYKSQLENVTSSLSNIASSFAKQNTLIMSVKQRRAKGDENNLYPGLHKTALVLIEVSSVVALFGLPRTNVKDIVQLSALNADEFDRSLGKYTTTIDQFADEVGGKYVGWLRGMLTTTGITLALAGCASAVSACSDAIKSTISRTDTPVERIKSLTTELNNISVHLKDVVTTMNRL